MAGTKDMDRYEKRAREIMEGMNRDIREGRLVAGTKEYDDLRDMIDKFLKASKTYKKKE